MKNILIPFDFSKASYNALDYAVQFAADSPQLNLHLLHVNTEDGNETEIMERLHEVVSKYKKNQTPEIKLYVLTGQLNSSILSIQEELKIDLMIMGTTGAQVGKETMDTNTSKFVHKADLPVLVIPENTKNFRIKTIILSLGKDKIADKNVLHNLLDVSRRFNAQVHVLTIDRGQKNIGYTEEDESNERTLQYFLEMFYSHHSFHENEDIEKGIKEYLEANHVDMLAIMPNTHLEEGEASKGSLTRILTLRTQTPLLILD
ncbi:Nucleotide-binding universal stress protein, UspA family [Salegentibacter echinorum]|uniref:Nucleotide-binding universal stress protein, UspA family n=1 Tax=Salegentibacter echinorum TaxID=1073325 RepID=A0A1M5KZK3_SALEC|nr:universal stress protein [Salegentibacter echinorum]SHG58228.1 Nucleotide-binding universal stress protein, UspA family [Salegentibacter echinorum]